EGRTQGVLTDENDETRVVKDISLPRAETRDHRGPPLRMQMGAYRRRLTGEFGRRKVAWVGLGGVSRRSVCAEQVVQEPVRPRRREYSKNAVLIQPGGEETVDPALRRTSSRTQAPCSVVPTPESVPVERRRPPVKSDRTDS